jgi:hypothetical protein
VGNSAWGNGYHQGQRTGRLQGAGAGTAGTLVVGGLIIAGKWGYDEFQKRRAAKSEQRLLAERELSNSGEEGVRGDDRNS